MNRYESAKKLYADLGIDTDAAIEKLSEGRTTIMIAHRLSTIRQCDRVIVLDGGKIIEDGTYDELIAKNGFFAELVERQRIEK